MDRVQRKCINTYFFVTWKCGFFLFVKQDRPLRTPCTCTCIYNLPWPYGSNPGELKSVYRWSYEIRCWKCRTNSCTCTYKCVFENCYRNRNITVEFKINIMTIIFQCKRYHYSVWSLGASKCIKRGPWATLLPWGTIRMIKSAQLMES